MSLGGGGSPIERFSDNPKRLSRYFEFRPRKRIPLAPGYHILQVGLELTQSDEARLREYAAARWPRRPDGRHYLGKAASVLYHLGVKYVRDELGNRREPELEEIYGAALTEQEARDAGLFVIDRPSEIGRADEGDPFAS